VVVVGVVVVDPLVVRVVAVVVVELDQALTMVR
jgi:hypothetical protein